MSLRARLSAIAAAQASFGVLPSDSENVRRSKAILTFLAGSVSFLSLFWVAT